MGINSQTLSKDHEALLHRLDRMIDPAAVEEMLSNQRLLLTHAQAERQPTLVEFYKPITLDWPVYTAEEQKDSPEKWLVSALMPLYRNLKLGFDFIPAISFSPGTMFMAALAGCALRHTGGTYWVEEIEEPAAIERLIKGGVPDLTQGWGGKILAHSLFALRQLACFPNLGKVVKVCLPDLQGPFDIAHTIVGADIYYHMVDYPDLIEELVAYCGRVMRKFMDTWQETMQREGFADRVAVSPYASLIGGRLRLVNDTATNISPEMYQRFSRPFDEQLIQEYGGNAWVHFCGSQAEITLQIMETPGVKGMDIAGITCDYRDRFPEVWAKAQAKKIGLIFFQNFEENGRHEEPLFQDFEKEEIRTGALIIYWAGSLEDARRWAEEHVRRFNEKMYRTGPGAAVDGG